MAEKLRILLSKVGLDGHDRGIRVIETALRKAGMDVFYSGLHQTAPAIAQLAREKKVHVVAVSSLTGAHLTIFPAVVQALKDEGLADVHVIGGGIVPAPDHPKLRACGVGKMFEPGATTNEIVEYLQTWFRTRRR